MAVTPTHLTTGSSTTNTTSYTTASITPTANQLVLIAVMPTVTSGTTPTMTVSGTGLTWVQENTSTPGFRTMVVFRAMGASPTAGALTITAAASVTSCLWSVVQFDGIDTTGTNGSGAIAQSFNASPGSTNNLSSSFPTTPAAGNGGFAGVGIAVQELPVGGTGWTTQSTSQSAPTSGLAGLYADTCPAAVTATWTTATNSFLVGVEILAAAGGGGTVTVQKPIPRNRARFRASFY